MNYMNKRIGISLAAFLKATIVGGLLFLLPLVLISIVLGHGHAFGGQGGESGFGNVAAHRHRE